MTHTSGPGLGEIGSEGLRAPWDPQSANCKALYVSSDGPDKTIVQTDPFPRAHREAFNERFYTDPSTYPETPDPSHCPCRPINRGSPRPVVSEHTWPLSPNIPVVYPGEREAIENKEGGTEKVGPNLLKPGTTFGHQCPYQVAYQLPRQPFPGSVNLMQIEC